MSKPRPNLGDRGRREATLGGFGDGRSRRALQAKGCPESPSERWYMGACRWKPINAGSTRLHVEYVIPACLCYTSKFPEDWCPVPLGTPLPNFDACHHLAVSLR